jgi:hypothetical protein
MSIELRVDPMSQSCFGAEASGKHPDKKPFGLVSPPDSDLRVFGKIAEASTVEQEEIGFYLNDFAIVDLTPEPERNRSLMETMDDVLLAEEFLSLLEEEK